MSLIQNEMYLLLLLMMIVAPLGAIDLIYFHIVKFKLHQHSESRMETVVHLVRGVLFSSGAFFLLNYKPTGIWFWMIGALFLLDFANSIVDVSIERRSRQAFGGIPTLEYIIHTIGSTFGGAITVAYFLQGWEYRLLPTALNSLPADTFPKLFSMNGNSLVIGGLVLTLLEATLLCRATAKNQKKVSYS